MKKLFLLIALFSISAQAAPHYTCQNKEGNKALLIQTSKNQVLWNEPWHSAFSTGSFVGKETAPYDPERGADLFVLSNFYHTPSSAYYLALRYHQNRLFAVTYFDHDDHKEERVVYRCFLTHLK